MTAPWTGREARALRAACRLSVRAFAIRLGMHDRTVSRWEQLGADATPYSHTQKKLDAVLAKATPAERDRFHTELLHAPADPDSHSRPEEPPGAGLALGALGDLDLWADDLDRANAYLAHQQFGPAQRLIDRWLVPNPAHPRSAGTYLHGRSLMLLANAQRDQGNLLGPRSAERLYRQARALFTDLGNARRVAQADLALAVVAEMAGNLAVAARRYEQLADDPRLSARDRARARLWIGTAISKTHRDDAETNRHAAAIMAAAITEFDIADEPEDWATAMQKLALAHRGAGRLEQALRDIGIAAASGTAEVPMQRVRLDTAHAHILLTDPQTRGAGITLLDHTAELAYAHNLAHQLHAINELRSTSTVRTTKGNRL